MAESVKNARRSDEAERSRHLAATESVAFATMLLGLLNDADAVLHRLEHESEARAAEPAAPHPAEAIPAALVPADPAPGHDDQHAGTIEAPATELAPALHAGATAATSPQATSETVADTPSGQVLGTQIPASSAAPASLDAPLDHAPSAGAANGSVGSIAPPSFELGATVHTITDTVTGIVDSALATVSSTIASLSSTVGQLTSSVSDTVNHLTDGLLGTITGGTHDAPSTGVIEPLVADLLSPAPSPAEASDAAHGVPLLDTAGAIPTALLHPMPLQLGFLGQPTMDGHEPHDGAFSALGVHHF
ncbi:hypothetical protein [Bradyrhizobium archetypum]|uniref:Uncharacterized protein n=1 Tax=Bradyrhizobium archetypum TaxID=2721160 RepID=A0A7Y4M1M7_9BRAD|nr:hypothetical protein [Bradyrhizobium archetypum]NOJ46621.1 hypothetical protein [Bradyrhizobium archetypum]